VVIGYVPPQQPSPRAQELGQRVALTIAEFQQKYPDLSAEEVQQALALASDRSPDRARPAASVAALVAGVAAAAGLGVFLLGDRIPIPHGGAVPAIVAACVAALAVAVVRRRRE
jgi:peptidoglycan/LPS O-acetylase OafA/YrhL